MSRSYIDTESGVELYLEPEAAVALVQAYKEASVILEYGSGGSTQVASKLENKFVMSVESDRTWATNLQHKINTSSPKSDVIVHYENIGQTGLWGRPINLLNWRKFHKYPLGIWDQSFFIHPDIVLIDGRLRNACLATVILKCEKDTVVFFDDFYARDLYQNMEKFIKPTASYGTMARFDIAPDMFSKRDLNFLIEQFSLMSIDGDGEKFYRTFKDV